MTSLSDARDGVVRSVVWRDLFPCLLLTRALRISFRPSILLTAFGGYILMGLGGWFIGAVVFARTEDRLTERWRREFLQITWDRDVDHAFFARIPDRSVPRVDEARPDGMRAGEAGASRVPTERPRSVVMQFFRDAAVAPAIAWWQLTAPLVRLFQRDLTSTGLVYLLLCNAWNIAVWGLFGGAIARMAALDFARQEALGIGRGIAQAGLKYPGHVAAPALAALALFVLALPLIVVGLFARLETIALLTGILWIAALLLGLLLAILAVGLVVGWPLLWAAIAVEQSEAFDAVSRTYAYVYQRPLHLAGYVLYAAVLAMIGALAVNVFATAAVALTDSALGWGTGRETLRALQGQTIEQPDAARAAGAGEAESGEEAAGARSSRLLQGAIVGRRFWIRTLACLAAAYPLGVLWSVAVGVYLLLRLHVDAAQVDEIVVDEVEPLAGLPRLTPHESGIPGVAPPRGSHGLEG